MVATPDEYVLEDAEQIHAEHPDTFWLPSRHEREQIEVGADVKLIFKPTDPNAAFAGERMWVTLHDVSNPLFFTGVLNNDPAVFENLQAGDTVYFRPENIIDIFGLEENSQ